MLEPPRDWIGLGQQDVVVPLLVGEVAKFGYMSLLDCHGVGLTIGGLASTQTLQVDKAITKVHLDYPEDPFVRRVEMAVPAMSLLLGRDPVRPKRRMSSRSKEARFTLDSRRHTWTEDGVEVEISYKWSLTHDRVGVDVRMIPQVHLSSATSRSLTYWVEEWIGPLDVFTRVSTGHQLLPTWVRVYDKKHITSKARHRLAFEVWSPGIDPENGDTFRRMEARDLRPLISLGQLADRSIHDVLARTKRLLESHGVFWSLLEYVLKDADRPMRNRYLDAMAALEAFDSKSSGIGPLRVDEFRSSRAQALSSVTDPTAKKFLKRWVSNRSVYSLPERLRRIQKQIHADWEVDASTMAEVRNDIAHGNAHPDGHVLGTALDQAVEAGRRLVLREVGVV